MTDRLVTIPIPFAGTPRIAHTLVEAQNLAQLVGSNPEMDSSAVSAFDRKLGELCAFRIAADHKIRCLAAVPTQVEYTDAQCTTPVVSLPTPCGLMPKHYVDFANGRCTPASVLTVLSGKPATNDGTPTWHPDGTGACAARGPTGGLSAAERVPDADFVEAQIVTR